MMNEKSLIGSQYGRQMKQDQEDVQGSHRATKLEKILSLIDAAMGLNGKINKIK